LGVAGSVVGIVSLGIQVTQGLLKYYGSWKDQDSDVSEMCISLDALSRTLTILLETIQPPAKFGMSITENVEKNIKNIDQALSKLKDVLRKVQGPESPKPGVRSAMQRQLWRALYPFTKETLSKIQRIVSEAHLNLNFALQVLQVFVYLIYWYCFDENKLIRMSSNGISGVRYEVNILVHQQEGAAYSR